MQYVFCKSTVYNNSLKCLMYREWREVLLIYKRLNFLISNVIATILDSSLHSLITWNICWFWEGAGPVKYPERWLPYRDHCFVVHRDPRDWKEALISCSESNGNLASIRNPEEHGFLLSQLGYSEYFYRFLSYFYLV